MAKRLQTLLKQINQLQKQADTLRSREKVGVIERIKIAMEHYDITESELFGTGGVAQVRKGRTGASATSGTRKAHSAGAGAGPKKPAGVPKYTDGGGRTWSGVGKRPTWFKEALADGKAAEDLLIAR